MVVGVVASPLAVEASAEALAAAAAAASVAAYSAAAVAAASVAAVAAYAAAVAASAVAYTAAAGPARSSALGFTIVGKSIPVTVNLLVVKSKVAAETFPTGSTYVKSHVMLWQGVGSPSTVTIT